MLVIWILIFCVSLFILIKAADFFTESAEKIGLIFKISPFILGVTIITFGTTLPELSTAIIAVIKNQTEIAVANAIGSNITNILLIVGFLAIISRGLKVKRSIIDIELPFLTAATALIVIILWDKQVTIGEGIVAILGYITYAACIIRSGRKLGSSREGILPGEDIPVTREHRYYHCKKRLTFGFGLVVAIIISAIFVYFSAKFTIISMNAIALAIGIPISLVTMSALALGTSLPELAVSYIAVRKGKYEIALGNVFGANIFNVLMVIGIPALFKNLTVDEATFAVGIPFIIGATVLYIFSGISREIRRFDGVMYLLIYVLFIAKLFGLF